MVFIRIILILIVLALAFPVGLILSKMCDDEIKKRRNWYGRIKLIAILAVIVILFFPLDVSSKIAPMLALLFTAIVMAVMEFKGRQKAKRKS